MYRVIVLRGPCLLNGQDNKISSSPIETLNLLSLSPSWFWKKRVKSMINMWRFGFFGKAERLRRQAEQERQEAVENLSAAQNQANTLSQAKRKLEGTIAHMQEEAEDLENEAKNADDRAKKAAIEVRSF